MAPHSLNRKYSVMLYMCVVVFVKEAEGTNHSKTLFNDLMTNYSKLILPVTNTSENLIVKLGLKLSQLIGVDEKNQVMTTIVWLPQEWKDIYLKWNTEDYGGVDHIHIPADDIWKPDIVLYNNADGNFQVTPSTKATVYSDGTVYWEPPAIYKSSCAIDVEFFPFDEQTCTMKFSSWTYVQEQVDLRHMDHANVTGEVEIDHGIDMGNYAELNIWDILAVPATKNEIKYQCCPEVIPDITFSLIVRRKTLFYTINLIIPCVAISFLTILVFYLPSDSGEKVTLCISVLLALTVFYLLLSELIPPTSVVIPLIGKYLLFTMILVTCSIVITVGVLNLHYRSICTHHMPEWVKTIFLEKLPTYLLMKRPEYKEGEDGEAAKRWKEQQRKSLLETPHKRSRVSRMNSDIEMESLLSHVKVNGRANGKANGRAGGKANGRAGGKAGKVKDSGYYNYCTARGDHLSSIERDALECVEFIADHLQEEDEEDKVAEDWKYVAMVVDRLFLWIFSAVCCLGTVAIMLAAKSLFDNRKPLDIHVDP